MSAALAKLALVAPARWLDTEKAMLHTGWSDRWLRAKAESGFVVSRESSARSANGRPQREYLESSLPISPVSPTPAALTLASQADPLPLFAGLPKTERVALPDPEQQKEVQRRYEILTPILDFAENRERYAHLRLSNGRRITCQEQIIRYTAELSNISTSTLKRWLARYRIGGFAALADRERADKGTSRWFERHPDARIFAGYLYLVERTSISFVCEQLEYEAERLGIVADLPSRETVRVFLAQSISPAMKTYAREGERAYRQRMAPYLKRGYVDTYANSCLVGDHAIHDVEVSNDVFSEVPFGTPGRLRLSAFIDYRSRKAWGTWAWEGSSRSIAATLLRVILEVGPPEHIYVDNGKDYKKVAKGATAGCEIHDDERAPRDWWQTEYSAIEKTGMLARLGISVTHCIPRHPQSKHVERFFRTLHERFDAAHSTYTSGSPATRPEQTGELMARHRWLLKRGRVEESQHPLASQIILACTAWIEDYNNTPHTGEGMDGLTPNQVFAAERNPNQKPAPDPQTLALLMMDYERRLVRECAVTIAKRRYTPRPNDRSAWAAMHESNETEILVAFNATDPEFAAALTLDGNFLAWLECEELLRFAPWDPKTQEQIGQSMEMRRGMEKATRQSLRAIAGAARANGARSAQELLYDRLQIPAAVDQLVTQRKPRLKPDHKAQAPASASDIASQLWEEFK